MGDYFLDRQYKNTNYELALAREKARPPPLQIWSQSLVFGPSGHFACHQDTDPSNLSNGNNKKVAEIVVRRLSCFYVRPCCFCFRL